MAYAELSDVEDGNEDVTIVVTTTYNERELIKTVPGARWKSSARQWQLPLGWAQCVILRGVFGGDIEFGEKLLTWGWRELNERVKPMLLLRKQLELPNNFSGKWFFDERLFSFQRVGATFLCESGDCLLADEMGTGKTLQALAALWAKHLSGQNVFPAVVICPNSVKFSWEKEIKFWYPEMTPIVINGSAKEKRDIFASVKNAKNAIVIINIEAARLHSRLASYGSIRLTRCSKCDPKYGSPNLTPSRCESHPKELNALGTKTVIVDEAHRIKDPKSKQTRATWAVMHELQVTTRWALTGTPLANDPSDLWSVMHGIAPYEYPSRSRFVDRYCLQSWNGYGIQVLGISPEHKEEFYKILDPRMRRMTKSVVLKQLPKKMRTRRFVEMTPKQKKAYDEMSRDLITRLDNGDILVAPNNLAAQIRLLQLSSSYCEIFPDERNALGTGVRLMEPSPKLDALDDIMDEHLGPIVACAQSRQLIELAAARMEKAKIPYGLITGKQTQWERNHALKQFQAGDLRILLFTVQAGGTGLTMTAADTIVFLQRSWSMIDNKQAEDRVHRIGSERHESINVIDVITRGTVEERQVLRLYDKMQRLEEIVRDRELLASQGMSTEELDAEEARILNSNLGVL